MKLNKFTIAELSVGKSFEIERKVTEEKINQFAELTGDYHPLHTNHQYAKRNGFKNIIAHGLLISSFSSALVAMKLIGENTLVLSQSFKYRQPALAGDHLKIYGEIKSIDDRFSTIAVQIKISNQNDAIVATGQYLLKLREELDR